ncbi:MAG TPA: hypothetical protein VK541_11285 [Pedobacter sp.]|uniref:hypothetical protein n=1 Tax=Pedobacter sp. TaxID=1411316 RepID=UPI002BD3BA18|nr:hypothetical protein [Pedobacter sp.]HMI03058.1 hypothetical protein [Pedobacter sp.]
MCNQEIHHQIINAICKALDINDIKTESRRPVYAHARFIAIKLLIDKKYSYCRIAYMLNRDITTIYFGERRCKQLVKQEDEIFAIRLTKIKRELEALCA